MLFRSGDEIVAAVDPRPRAEGLAAIRGHALASRIRVIEGDPGDPAVVAELRALADARAPVAVVLDLIHTHDHVTRELRALTPLVSAGSYAVVLDTVMEDLPATMFEGRPYGKGNNPGTAVRAFLAEHPDWMADPQFEDRVLLTLAPGGFLRRVGDAPEAR